jgi:hypothetical protein
MRVFLLQKRCGVLVGHVDDKGIAVDSGEPGARDPVLETLRAQLLFELFFDKIPWALLLTSHKTTLLLEGPIKLLRWGGPRLVNSFRVTPGWGPFVESRYAEQEVV